MRLPGPTSAWIVGAVALVTCVLACLRHPPAPLLHDEFSYLLAGETFADGRIANLAHPLWEHFETEHVLQQPSYASKYPPGQGLVLAFGMWFGRPILGVWLSMVFAAMAITWMLEGWVRRPWPLIGGLAFALHPQIVQAWGATFWGGAVATAGGALVYGALPRILKRPGRIHVGLFCFGGFLLALSRPFEGLIACLPVAAILFWAIGGYPRWLTEKTVPVLVAALLGTLGVLALVNYMTTGDPLLLPYVAYHQQYEVAPLFLFQELRPEPHYNHELLRTFFTVSAVQEYDAGHSMSDFLGSSYTRGLHLGRFFFGVAALPVFVAALFRLRDERIRFTLIACALFAFVLALETFSQPHYAAPFVGCGMLLTMCLVERFWEVERWRFPVQLGVIGLFSSVLVGHWLRAEDWARDRESYALSKRGALVRSLEEEGGQHLVIVRYGEDHNPHLEWVWNDADIDRSAVVWAREMEPVQNARLLSYFVERRAWLFEPDRDPTAMTPYPVADSR